MSRGCWIGLATLVACAQPEDTPSASSDLIGGTSVKLGDLPATLHLEAGCTAVKVAPRFLLTAAHCVLDLSTLDPRYDADRPVKLARDPAAGHVDHAVVKVHPNPVYLKACEGTFCSIPAVVQKLDAPDVALIELVVDLEEVPIARIDPEPVLPGRTVTIVGYGCTEGVHVADTRASASLASAETAIVDPLAAVHPGSPVLASDAPVYGGNYLLTAGTAGLCPGDSGGPALRMA